MRNASLQLHSNHSLKISFNNYELGLWRKLCPKSGGASFSPLPFLSQSTEISLPGGNASRSVNVILAAYPARDCKKTLCTKRVLIMRV